jgi:hypothetical protein
VFLANTFYKPKSKATSEHKFSGDPNTDFILIFEGEISGFGYVSTDRNKEFIINCVSHGIVFQDVKLEFLFADKNLFNPYIPGQALAALSSYQLKDVFPLSLFTKGISISGKLIEHPTDLLTNIVNFIQEKQGYVENTPSELSDFYSKYFKTLKMDKRYPTLSIFDEKNEFNDNCFPLLSGITSDAALRQLYSYSSQSFGPNYGSLFEILTFILEKMEYEFSLITNPSGTASKINFMCLKPMLYEAVPPLCNIIFKSHVGSIQTFENTHAVPTRIRVRDLFKVPGVYDSPDPVAAMGYLDYYPTEKYTDQSSILSAAKSKKDMLSSELLSSETHTGPFLYDCSAPPWTTFLTDKDITGSSSLVDYKKNIMKSQLQMKILESRNFTVTTAFNPYIVQGFPAVVYDTEETGFIFVGYVLGLQHQLGKRGMSTTVTLGLVRDIQDELSEDTMLNNTFKMISDKYTHKSDVMSNVYGSMINSDAVDYTSLKKDYIKHDAQYDSLAAYEENSRNIVNFKDYIDFMGLSPSPSGEIVNSYGDTVYTSLDGDYVSSRNDESLREKVLKPLANEIFNTRIYL